jgi:hypothetical protein
MNNRPFTFGMGKLAFFGVGLSVLAVHASIDSGGEMGSVGSLASHSSLGAPFATSSVTAGGIDMLYPLQIEPLAPPAEKPPSGSPAGGGDPAPATKKGKTGAGISKKNSSSNKKSSANKAQNKKSVSATNKNSKSKKKSKKK